MLPRSTPKPRDTLFGLPVILATAVSYDPWVQGGRNAPQPEREGPPPEEAFGRIRVGLLCPVLNLGGAETWQLSLLESLCRERIALQGVAVTGGRAATNSAQVSEHAALAGVTFGRAAAARLAARCDVIVQWAVEDIPSLLPRHGQCPKVVSVIHSPPESPWGTAVYARTSGTDSYVAVSELAVEALPEHLRAEAKVIWNAVRTTRLVPNRERPRPVVRAAWGVPENAKVLGFVGRLEPDKNPEAVANAVAELPERWHAVIVGEGPQKDALVAAYAGDHRVRFVGGDTDMGSVLGAMDALCVPSDYESFGLSLCEGLWFGIPVISTEVGVCKLAEGLTRLIPNRATGPSVANGLLTDLADRAGTRERVRRAWTWARERLTPTRFGREWTELILSVAIPVALERPRYSTADSRLHKLVSECPARQRPPCGCQSFTCSFVGEVSYEHHCLPCQAARTRGLPAPASIGA